MRSKIVHFLGLSNADISLVKAHILFRRRIQSGFSLIELMVAAGIVSVLASVAIPSYISFTKNSNVSSALTALVNLSAQMEKNYLDVRNYGTGNSCAVSALNVPDYSFNCSTNGQDYVWTAKSDDTKYEYSVNQNGLKNTAKFEGATLTNKNCWLLNNKDTCY